MSEKKIQIVQCPHCEQAIEIVELNCRIFRCGVLISNYQQINPHLDESSCKDLKAKKLIYGCGKPFRITSQNLVEICGYI
jgi:hypothetical protein